MSAYRPLSPPWPACSFSAAFPMWSSTAAPSPSPTRPSEHLRRRRYIKIPGLDDGANSQHSLPDRGRVAAFSRVFEHHENRRERRRNGYRRCSPWPILKSGVIAASDSVCYQLSQYRGIPVILVWVLAICLIYNFITAKTAFGRYFYAVGGNEKATKLSGINTNKIYFIAYANMGLLAGLCGLLNAARVGSVNGLTGTSFEMDAIGACFIGGASAYGGGGTGWAAWSSALFVGVINMGMSIIWASARTSVTCGQGRRAAGAVIFDVITKRNVPGIPF